MGVALICIPSVTNTQICITIVGDLICIRSECIRSSAQHGDLHQFGRATISRRSLAQHANLHNYRRSSDIYTVISPNTMNCITIGEDPICIRSISDIYTGEAAIYILSEAQHAHLHNYRLWSISIWSEPNTLICINIGGDTTSLRS
jgi:hypothetical protein